MTNRVTYTDGDVTVIEVSFGSLDPSVPIDDIPYANVSPYSTGMWSIKDDNEWYDENEPTIETKDGYVDGTMLGGYVCVFCECPVSEQLDRKPYILHKEPCKFSGALL